MGGLVDPSMYTTPAENRQSVQWAGVTTAHISHRPEILPKLEN